MQAKSDSDNSANAPQRRREWSGALRSVGLPLIAVALIVGAVAYFELRHDGGSAKPRQLLDTLHHGRQRGRGAHGHVAQHRFDRTGVDSNGVHFPEVARCTVR